MVEYCAKIDIICYEKVNCANNTYTPYPIYGSKGDQAPARQVGTYTFRNDLEL